MYKASLFIVVAKFCLIQQSEEGVEQEFILSATSALEV